MRASRVVQTALRMIYPPTCLACDARVETEQGLCGACWRETRFVTAHPCDACGAPLAGDHAAPGELCDDCLRVARPWDAGRTALIYGGTGRRIVLGLKHGDRLDLMGPAARWMARAGGDLVQPDMLVTAIPLHWRRRVKRRYNQSVELGRKVARLMDLDFCPDVLIRPRATPVLDGKSPADRLRALNGALVLNPARQGLIAGRPVLLVDDVMTSGATLSVASRALTQGGAANVRVLTLARAVKEA